VRKAQSTYTAGLTFDRSREVRHKILKCRIVGVQANTMGAIRAASCVRSASGLASAYPLPLKMKTRVGINLDSNSSIEGWKRLMVSRICASECFPNG
jgi:hypothetical protein